MAKRRIEGLNLYEPMPVQQDFHACQSKERILRGSNRSGKTLGAAVEVARAVTGQDPLKRYPEKDGVAYIVGKDGRETGQVMWKKLARAGAFKIIRDLKTGEWRTFRPNDPADQARRHEAKQAPPLIPPRMIASISWENKKESLPKIVKLINGWELHFFSSLGKPPHGSDIDLAWFDEEIIDQSWYGEIAARLVDRSGYFLWSATPQAGTIQLYDLHERADQQAQDPNVILPATSEFVILLEDNEHLTREQKNEFAAKLSDEEKLVRVGGEFVQLTFKVFPEYTSLVYGVDPFTIPNDWARYLAVDPGRQICGVLFLAIPPPDHGEHAYIYDELYLKDCDAEMFGQRMSQKCRGQRFQSFLIDHQEGGKHETGGGRTIEDMYTDALRKHGVRSEMTGHHFEWGAAEPVAGVEAIRLWLRDRGDGTHKLRVMTQNVPNFDWEMRHYRRKRVEGIVQDRPEERGRVHLMACLRYLVQSNPRYVKPTKGGPKNPVLQALQRKKERARQRNGGGPMVKLGPGS